MTSSAARRIRHGVELVWALVSRDQKARYTNTALGIVWALMHPLLFLTVFYLLFGVVLGVQIEHYAAFVFTGVIVWTWLQSSIAEATRCISDNPGLVGQPGMPVAALPVAIVASNLVPFLISLPFLVVLLLIEGIVPGPSLLALPLIIALQFGLVLAACYFVAALNVPFRDMQQIVVSLLLLGYFATPIFYDVAALPDRVAAVLRLNPVLHLLDGYRAILLHGSWPAWQTIVVLMVIGSIALVAGLYVFRRGRQRFLEEI